MFELVTAGRCIFILIFVGKARSYCMRLLRSAWWASSRTCRHRLTICLTGDCGWCWFITRENVLLTGWWPDVDLLREKMYCLAWLVVTDLFWEKKYECHPKRTVWTKERPLRSTMNVGTDLRTEISRISHPSMETVWCRGWLSRSHHTYDTWAGFYLIFSVWTKEHHLLTSRGITSRSSILWLGSCLYS
jgi:hypothetical protein